jgi:hypothetical protein
MVMGLAAPLLARSATCSFMPEGLAALVLGSAVIAVALVVARRAASWELGLLAQQPVPARALVAQVAAVLAARAMRLPQPTRAQAAQAA